MEMSLEYLVSDMRSSGRRILARVPRLLALMMSGLMYSCSCPESGAPHLYQCASGMNFLLTAYRYSHRGLLLDPALSITDANAKIDLGLAGYVRTLDVAGKSTKAGVLQPYAVFFG
jgi:hypothetical protein